MSVTSKAEQGRLTDAVRARLALKLWSSSQAALSSGSIRPYSSKKESTVNPELSSLISAQTSLVEGISTNWKGFGAGSGRDAWEWAQALTMAECAPDGVALTIA
jgi:hypothetical protein